MATAPQAAPRLAARCPNCQTAFRVVADQLRLRGGLVGIDNLAAAIGEERDTIEDVLEPYLIQQGYLQRTPRGRVATASAYQHFGLGAPKSSAGPDLWDDTNN